MDSSVFNNVQICREQTDNATDYYFYFTNIKVIFP